MKEEQRPTLKALPPSVRKWVNNLYLSTLCWSKRNLTPAVNEKAGQCILFPFPKGCSEYWTQTGRRQKLHCRTSPDKENPTYRIASYQTSITFSLFAGLSLLLSADTEEVWKSAAASVCCVSLLWSAPLVCSCLSYFKQLLLLLPHTFLRPLSSVSCTPISFFSISWRIITQVCVTQVGACNMYLNSF